MVLCEGKYHSNHLRKIPKSTNCPDIAVLNTIMTAPGLGEKRAKQLLEHFGSIQAITSAKQESLEEVVGHKLATAVYRFFHYPIY